MARNWSVVLAHGSGLDDILWFVVPVISVMLWLRWSDRRARQKERDAGGSSTVDEP